MTDLKGKIPSHLHHALISEDHVAINQVHEQYLLFNSNMDPKLKVGKRTSLPMKFACID